MMRACLPLFVTLSLAVAQEGRLPPDADRPQPREPVFAALDANGDGVLSAEEIAAAPSALAELDRDGDGSVTAAELPRSPRPGPRMRGAAQNATEGSPERAPLGLDEPERQALAVLAELGRNRRGNMNVPEGDGRLLRMLVEATGAQHVVELGTSNGYSAIWIGLALQSTGGELTTHEIDPERAKVATSNLERAGVADRVKIVLGDAHEKVTELEAGIDLVFLDADKTGYLDYLQKLMPMVRPGGLICAHNMRRPAPDPDFIEAITTDPRLETLFLRMNEAGMAISLKKSGAEQTDAR